MPYSIQVTDKNGWGVKPSELEAVESARYTLTRAASGGNTSGELTPDMRTIFNAHDWGTRFAILGSDDARKIAEENGVDYPPEWP